MPKEPGEPDFSPQPEQSLEAENPAEVVAETQPTPEKKEEKHYGLSFEEVHDLMGQQIENRKGKKNDSIAGKDYKTFEELCDDLEGRTVVESRYGGYYRLRSDKIIAEITRLQKQAEEELKTRPWEEIMRELGPFGNSYEMLDRGIKDLERKFPELDRVKLHEIMLSFERSIVQDRMKREGLTSQDWEKIRDADQARRVEEYKQKEKADKAAKKSGKKWFGGKGGK